MPALRGFSTRVLKINQTATIMKIAGTKGYPKTRYGRG
jgi:hypothetical protein